MKWIEKDVKFLTENYPSMGPKQLSLKLNRSVDSVNLKLKLLNIRGKINNKYKKFKFDISNKEHLYIMGFLWADGFIHKSLNRLELSILSDDFEDIKNLFDSDYWAIYVRNRKGRRSQTTIGLYDKEVCELFRKKYNYVDKSIFPPNFLNHIDDELLYYFILGFFDGDGCFYMNKNLSQRQCYICGGYDQDWTWLEKLFNNINVEYVIKRKEQKNGKYSVIYIKSKSIDNFGNYIYQDYESNNIGLSRKYNKFLDCKK